MALATLAANGVASALLSQLQLESDAYGLVGGFECYLHLVNVLSVFGFIGSLRVCVTLACLHLSYTPRERDRVLTVTDL